MGKCKEKGSEQEQHDGVKKHKKHKLDRKEDRSCIEDADKDVRQNTDKNLSVKLTERKTKKTKKHNGVVEKSVAKSQAQITTDSLEAEAKAKRNGQKRNDADCLSSLECVDVENKAHCSEKDGKAKTGKEDAEHNSLALGFFTEQSPKKKKHKKDKSRDHNGDSECVTENPGHVNKKRSRSKGLDQTELSGKETCEEPPPDGGPAKKQKKSRHRRPDFPEQQAHEALARDSESKEQQGDTLSGAVFSRRTVQCETSGEVISKMNIQDDCCEGGASRSGRKKKKHSKGDSEHRADLEIKDSADSTVVKEMEQERQTSKKKKSKKSKNEHRHEEPVFDVEIPSSTECAERKELEQGRQGSKKKKLKKGKKENTHEEPAVDVKVPSSAECGESNEAEERGKASEKKKSKTAKDVSISHHESAEMEVVTSENCDKDEEKGEVIKKPKKHKALNGNKKKESGSVHSLPDDQVSSSSHKVKKSETGDALGKIHLRNDVDAQTVGCGQWNTQMFENSERQTKFLRLLGGFKKGTMAADASKPEGNVMQKKGLFGSLKPMQSFSFGGSGAASYEQAGKINSRLETDFTNALSYSLGGQRGKGLGYQPDPGAGKKFHIDINKCSSKKFDD